MINTRYLMCPQKILIGYLIYLLNTISDIFMQHIRYFNTYAKKRYLKSYWADITKSKAGVRNYQDILFANHFKFKEQ